MGAIIGLDVGTIRVGCAVADSSIKIPFPRAIWNRAKGLAEKEILNIINELKPISLIVGIPLNSKGERTPICDAIEQFCQRITKRASVKIEYVDEAFTSVEASERMRGFNNDGPVDAAAACLILERYFETGGL